jgi:hypothetical protein
MSGADASRVLRTPIRILGFMSHVDEPVTRCYDTSALLYGIHVAIGVRNSRADSEATMPSQEEIDQQLKRLTAYRRTLAIYLDQQATLGSAHAPPGVLNGINETRDSIRRIKATLQDWGVTVDDHPNDEESPVVQPSGATTRQSSIPNTRILIPLVAIVVVAVIAIVLSLISSGGNPPSIPTQVAQATIAEVTAVPTAVPTRMSTQTALSPTVSRTSVSTALPTLASTYKTLIIDNIGYEVGSIGDGTYLVNTGQANGKAVTLQYDLTRTNDDRVGVVMILKTAQDVTPYKFIQFNISFNDPEARCVFFLDDQSENDMYVVLGDGEKVTASTQTQSVKLSLDSQSFEKFDKVDRTKVLKIALEAWRELTQGQGTCTISDIQFTEE